MNLKQHCKSHTTGGITWWLLPYVTLRNNAAVTEFNHIVPTERQEIVHKTFVAVEGYTIDAEFASELTPDEVLFQDYWRTRALDMSQRWNAFMVLARASVLNAFWEAHAATREAIIERSESDPES